LLLLALNIHLTILFCIQYLVIRLSDRRRFIPIWPLTSVIIIIIIIMKQASCADS